MTVLTKPVSSHKDDLLKETLVPEVALTIENANARSLDDVDPDDEADAYRRADARRRSTLYSQTCLLITAIIALCLGFIGAVHLARQFRGTGPYYYRGYCRIPYSATLSADSMISGKFRTDEGSDGTRNELQPVFEPELAGERLSLQEKFRKDGTLEFDYELDLDFEEFESFELPEISHGRYIHDFKVNKTAIIDPDGGRCFVLDLDREEIPRPRNLLEVIRNMRDGTYEMDIEEVRHDTRVVLPPIQDLESYGMFIFAACSDKTTYLLERATNVIVKRSADGESEFQFMEFTGKKMVKYNIINLADV